MSTSIIGLAPMGNQKASTKAVSDTGMKARGESIAELLVKCVKEQATSLKRFLIDISELDQAGRKAFRLAVNAHLKQIRAHVIATKGTPEEQVYATTARSAGVRLSEAVTFSRACDAGYSPAFDEMPYHSCIGMARVFLQSESSTGPTVLRGRKPVPVLDKVKAFILKLESEGLLKHADLHAVATMVETMAKLSAAKAAKVEPIEAAKGNVVMLPTPARANVQGEVSSATNAAIERAAAAK